MNAVVDEIEVMVSVTGKTMAACSHCGAAVGVQPCHRTDPLEPLCRYCGSEIHLFRAKGSDSAIAPSGRVRMYSYMSGATTYSNRVVYFPGKNALNALAEHIVFGAGDGCELCQDFSFAVDDAVDHRIAADNAVVSNIVERITIEAIDKGWNLERTIQSIQAAVTAAGYTRFPYDTLEGVVCDSINELKSRVAEYIEEQIKYSDYRREIHSQIEYSVVRDYETNPWVDDVLADMYEVSWMNLFGCETDGEVIEYENLLENVERVLNVRTIDDWPRCMTCCTPLCLAKEGAERNTGYCHRCDLWSYIDHELLV